MAIDLFPTDLVWRNALAVIPLALIVAAVCRWAPCRPSTRHTLWLTLLAVLVMSPLLPTVPLPSLPDLPLAVVSTDFDDAAAGRNRQESTSAARGSGRASVEAETPGSQRSDRSGAASRVAPGPAATLAYSDQDPPPRGIASQPKAHSAITRVAEPSLTLDQSHLQPKAGAWPDPRVPQRHGVLTAAPDALPDSPANDEIGASAQPQVISSSAPSRWRQWLTQLAAIRDAVMSLPPLPAAIWLGGVAMLVLIATVRIIRSLRLIRESTPAPPWVVKAVRSAAEGIGLKRIPVTLMVNQCISPMVWSGRRCYLVLPKQLWGQLDEPGRRTVLYHELAHLRRRDHWVCWADMVIGCVYWWHPVVWWIRRRVREEADLSCDAWVTALLPRGRRAYAQALLDTRTYTSMMRPAGPAVGLGVSTLRTRRFARRLTMVMTEQSGPRLSRRGLTLACTLAIAGLVVTPIWACPPSSKAKQKRVQKLRLLEIPAAPAPPAAPQTAPSDDTTTFEQYMRDRNRSPGGDTSLEQRLKDLERQIEILQQQLERLRGNVGVIDGTVGGVPQVEVTSITAPSMQLRLRGKGPNVRGSRRPLPQPAKGPTVRGSRRPPQPAKGPTVRGSRRPLPQPAKGPIVTLLGRPPQPAIGRALSNFGSACRALCCACLGGGGPSGCETVVRSYELSAGKLKALTEFMVRSDVPITVAPSERCIEVHATECQQCVFELFCLMIGGDDQEKTYHLPEGKLNALTELMARPDVPIFIGRGDDGVTVHGTDLEQAVFQAFVKMIDPERTAESSSGPPAAQVYAQLEGKASQYEMKAASEMVELQRLQAAMRAIEAQLRAFERQAEQLMNQADRMEDQAADLEDQADALEDAAEELEGSERVRAITMARSMSFQAQNLVNQALALAAQAEAVEGHADNLEEQVDEVEQRLEVLDEEGDDGCK